ncbi:AMP-binding protein, partial [Methanoculleus chikugoensis]|uniref:AMP-binding protein n=1 Tax=Methanoculleus chikugoensis TaxID=118126 RepID=UPI000B1AFBF9
MPNCTTFLDANACNPPDKIALVVPPSRGEIYTRAELRDRVARAAGGLLALGIERGGEQVCIYLESSPEYLITYLALWRIGGPSPSRRTGYTRRARFSTPSATQRPSPSSPTSRVQASSTASATGPRRSGTSS